MIWKDNIHTLTCKYFLAILKKFYEILETLVKAPVKSAQAPANESVFAHHSIVYTFRLLLARFGLFFLSPPNCASFHSLVHSTLTHTHIHTHTASTDDREGKRGKSHYTNTHSYANSHPFTFTLTYTHTCTQI